MNKMGRGIVYIFRGKVAIVGLTLLNATLIPRTLGPEQMGFYTYWLSVCFILGTLLDLGGSPIIFRYIPEFRKRDEGKIRPLIRMVLLLKDAPRQGLLGLM